ncbi:MAG: TIM barrel protein [Candidatus Omnitrophica bacterium]|nr:TIM barrel protein [Candidatus Omnitrophota bacterium]
MLAISTTWNYNPDGDIKAWLKQVKALGLNVIELNYSLTREHLAQLPALIKEMDLQVVSVHNFCPLPDVQGPSSRHASNYFRLSSLDEQERQNAVKWTKNTIDTAKSFGASVVVVHAGTVEMGEDDRIPSLFDLFKAGKAGTPEYVAELKRILDKRQKYAPVHLKALDKSFDEIMPYAKKLGIKIGLESRYYPSEIPNLEEVGHFLNQFYAQGLWYWHDVGHAEMNERLGIYSHEGILKAYREKMIGAHLHGMDGRKDHKAPFVGDMDLLKVLKYCTSDILKVIETHQSSAEEMESAVRRLM